MSIIYLYSSESNPQDIVLSDPTIPRGNAITGTMLTSQIIQSSVTDGTISEEIPVVVETKLPRYVIGLPSEMKARQRRTGKAKTEQYEQTMAAYGIVAMPVRGLILINEGKQKIKATGNKNTFNRDMQLILDLIDMEVA